MDASKFSRNAFLLFFFYLFIWLLLYATLPYYVSIEYKPIGFIDLIKAYKYKLDIINDKNFWVTPIGIFIRLFIELFITSVLFYAGCLFLKINLSFRLIVNVVTLAHTVFIEQYLLEFFYMRLNWAEVKGTQKEIFSLFSISDFLSIFKIKYNSAFGYALQTIGLFEIFYWIGLTYLFTKVIFIQFSSGVKIVLCSYIFPLCIWLLFVTFLSVI